MSKQAPKRIRVNGAVYVRADAPQVKQVTDKGYLSSDTVWDQILDLLDPEIAGVKKKLGNIAKAFGYLNAQPVPKLAAESEKAFRYIEKAIPSFQAEMAELERKVKATRNEMQKAVGLAHDTVMKMDFDEAGNVTDPDPAQASKDFQRWMEYARQWFPPHDKKPWD